MTRRVGAAPALGETAPLAYDLRLRRQADTQPHFPAASGG